MTWGSDDLDGKKEIDWKLHIALFPVYVLVAAACVMVFGSMFFFAIQFGTWGPLVGAFMFWFVAGLFYYVLRHI